MSTELWRIVSGLLSFARESGVEHIPVDVNKALDAALSLTGHLFNLFHCNETKCLMHFSGVIEDLNKIPFYLCRDCARRMLR